MFERFRRVSRRGAVTIGFATLAVVSSGCAKQAATKKQSVLRPAGPAARKILDLTTPFFWIAVVIGIGVVGATVLFAIKFREKPGEPRNPVQVHGNSTLEITWTIVPALILAVMGVFTVATIFDLSREPKGPNVIHVNVTGKQWWWEYDYTTAAGKTVFATANEMHIPINTPVYLKITSSDVIHSFWVPALAGKKDAVPGRTDYLTIEGSRVGEFSGQCAEYCGLSHANMHLKVFVDTKADYEKWAAVQASGPSAELSKLVNDASGLVVGYGCSRCHVFQPDSTGSRGPNLTHLGDRSTFAGATYDLTLDNLTKWIHDAPSMKAMNIDHKKGDALVGMPNFSGVGMTTDQARQLATELLCATSTLRTHEGVTCP